MSEVTFKFRTQIDIPRWDCPMEKTDGVVLLGSCFAGEMGGRMREYGLRVMCNPLGTLYNPASISLTIRHALHPQSAEPPTFQSADKWYCWWAGTSVFGSTSEECAGTVRAALNDLSEALKNAKWLFLTLGTNVCYSLRTDGQVVTNCHRAPATTFLEYSLPLEACIEELENLLADVIAVSPQLRVVFTVSPYRYAKYGFHGSQIAKSTLLLAVDEVCHRHPHVASYFPAYEILLDELRDYRFYSPDMLHPSSVTADYIWQRLVQSAMSTSMQQYLRQYESVRRATMHKPNDPQSEAYRRFLQQVEEKKRQLRSDFITDE